MSFAEELQRLHNKEVVSSTENTYQEDVLRCAGEICHCVREQLLKMAEAGKIRYDVLPKGIFWREKKENPRWQVSLRTEIIIDNTVQGLHYEVTPENERLAGYFQLERIELFSDVLDAVEKELLEDEIYPVEEQYRGKRVTVAKTHLRNDQYGRLARFLHGKAHEETKYRAEFACFQNPESI